MKNAHSKKFPVAIELSCKADVVILVHNGLYEAVDKNERKESGATTERSANGYESEVSELVNNTAAQL